MEFPITVENQDDFDKLVNARLSRERAKFADYDVLKKQVSDLTAERDSATQQAQGLQAVIDKAESERQLGKWRKQVEEETGVPGAALVGSTLEELQKHAETIKPYLNHAPHVPDPGKTPGDQKTEDDELRAFVGQLFGREA